MYEEAEAILKKLPKAVEENMDPPAESWSSSLAYFPHSHPSCHSTKENTYEKNKIWLKGWACSCCYKQKTVAKETR